MMNDYKSNAITSLAPDFIFQCSSVSRLANVTDAFRCQCIEAPHDIVFTVRWTHNWRPAKQRGVDVRKLIAVNTLRPETVKCHLILRCTTRTAVEFRRNIHGLNISSIAVFGTKHFCQGSVIFVPDTICYYCASEACTTSAKHNWQQFNFVQHSTACKLLS